MKCLYDILDHLNVLTIINDIKIVQTKILTKVKIPNLNKVKSYLKNDKKISVKKPKRY